MDYLPICIDLRGRACLVVGGGDVALRKVELLHAAGAELRIVAPALCAGLQALSRSAGMQVSRRRYASRDLRAIELVVAATSDSRVNAKVAADARARNIPVNVVDEPALCSFIMPAIIDRSPVLVSVSTGGASPSLARLTRSRLEVALPERFGRLADFAAEHRERVKQAIADMSARRLFWDRVLDGEIAELVLAGDVRAAREALECALGAGEPSGAAQVVLIAAGSGDPDRLPLGAVRWLGRADLILHEVSVPAAVLSLSRRDAERASVGQLGRRGGWTIATLARVAGERAQRGRPVCVLRVGDPYAGVTAREQQLLERAGIACVVFRPAP